MERYVCTACGYVYDPEVGDVDGGIAPGTAFNDIPDDWVCPVCGVSKDMFEKELFLILSDTAMCRTILRIIKWGEYYE